MRKRPLSRRQANTYCRESGQTQYAMTSKLGLKMKVKSTRSNAILVEVNHHIHRIDGPTTKEPKDKNLSKSEE